MPVTDRVRAGRLHAQRLDAAARRDRADVRAVVSAVAGIQAQDERAAALGVRVRSAGLRVDDVDRARGAAPAIVRIWCMRGTLHLVAAVDVRWLLAIYGPPLIRRGRRRLAQLGLDDDACARALPVVREALSDGPLTRHEIAAAVITAGVAVGLEGQAPIHLVRRACLEGVGVEAAPRDGAATYALLEEWVPGDVTVDRRAALATLARRYVAAFQPAGPDDFVAWSGLPARDVRGAWADVSGDLVGVDGPGPLWRLPDAPTAAEVAADAEVDAGVVRLLPAFDDHLLGYADRDHAVAPADRRAVHPGGGIIRPTVLLDGACVGTWTLRRSGSRPGVVVRPLRDLGRDVTDLLAVEVADIGRFLGAELECRLEQR